MPAPMPLGSGFGVPNWPWRTATKAGSSASAFGMRRRGGRRDVHRLAQQEDVVRRARSDAVGLVPGRARCVVVAVDDEVVDAPVRLTGVEDVDHVVVAGGPGRVTAEARLAPGRVDRVRVGAVLAVEGQRVPHHHVHGLQLVDDEEVLAVAGGRVDGAEGSAVRVERGRAAAHPRTGRRDRAVREGAAAEERLVEVERVGVGIAEQPRDVAVTAGVDLLGAARRQRARRDRPVEVHHGAVARVEIRRAVRERVVVAEDVDPLAGEHLRVLGDALGVGEARRHARVEPAERDVVARPQQDPAVERVDRRRVETGVRDEDVPLGVLDDEDRALVLGRVDAVGRMDQVEVVALTPSARARSAARSRSAPARAGRSARLRSRSGRCRSSPRRRAGP